MPATRLGRLLLFVFLLVPAVRAQVLPVGDPLEDYARLLQLTGDVASFSYSVRPLPIETAFQGLDPAARHPWEAVVAGYARPNGQRWGRVGLYDPEVDAYWNSTRPYGTNDGAVWQGRGLTTGLTTGVYGRLWAFSAAFRPVFLFTQNRDFELSPLRAASVFTPFAYATLADRYYPTLSSTIDLPQRFGDGSFTTFDPGPSFVRIDLAGVAAGLSNENMWWGPGTRHAIVMTNNAPGFPHGFLGTSEPVDLWVGRLQSRWVWGHLSESAYYDRLPENDRRFLTGIVVDFEPRITPGLSLGASRVFMQYDEPGTSVGDIFLVFQDLFKRDLTTEENPTGNDRRDQMISLHARWLLPESGFEAFGEWAKGDHNWDLRDFMTEPEHGSAYTVGFQKAFVLSPTKRLRVASEITKLESSKTVMVRSAGMGGFFYEHIRVPQGYTQRGQVIGAGIGPGSNSQYFGVDYFSEWGKVGFFGSRVVYDNDRYYRVEKGEEGGHEVELIAGAHGLFFYRGFEIGGGISFGRLLNQHYVYKNDSSNLNTTITVRRALMGLR